MTMKIKILNERREISDDVVELMSAKLTEAQAERTKMVSEGALRQTRYRDRPSASKDYWSDISTRTLG